MTSTRERILSAVGYSAERPIGESLWRRGWNDTKLAWSHWRFLVVDMVAIPLVGLLVHPLASIAVATSSLFLVWAGATIVAPIRQRDEALHQIFEAETHQSESVNTNDDAELAKERLEQSRLLDCHGQSVTGLDVFKTLAESLVTGIDSYSMRVSLADRLNEAGTWNDVELGNSAFKWLVLAEVVDVEHRPGAQPSSRGGYASIAAMPRDIYRLSELGRQVYHLVITP